MHATDLGTLDYIRSLKVRLEAAKHGGRGELIREACDFLRLSSAEVYRRLHAIGWASGRKRRADRGESALSYEDASTVSNILARSTRANGKRLLSVENAYAIALANGKIADAGVSPSHVARQLRARGLHPEQLSRPSAHMSMRSLHPNHTWQVDASVCVLYYIDTGGLATMSEKKFYKNKPENLKRIEKKRVIRYVLTDHYSGAFYLQYCLGSEDTENLFNFFLDGITRRDHPQDPFHGVPLQLQLDPGSANTSHLFTQWCERMQIRPLVHMPHNPRAKGQVESTMNIVECNFEGLLKFGKTIDSIPELNAHAHQWMRSYNGTREHSRHGHTRYALWQTIQAHQLRIAPPRELCQALLSTKPVEATVTRSLSVRYTIPSLGSHEYSVALVPDLSVGDKVLLTVNPYSAPAIWLLRHDDAGNDCRIELQPIRRGAAGFLETSPVVGESYRAHHDTPADAARKAHLKQAYGVETLREAEAAEDKRQPAFEGVDAFAHLPEHTAHYMERRGTTLPIERPRVEVAPLTVAQAAKALRARGVQMTKERYTRIASRYPNGVREEDLDRLAQMFGAGAVELQQEQKVVRMK